MDESQKLLKVSSSPHVHSGNSIKVAMRDVFLALLPATGLAVYFFGISAFLIILTCVASAVLAEYVCQKIRKVDITINDWSAALTGLFVALLLPPTLPLWMAAIGGATAIVLGKQVFGGLGNNLFNPALIGRGVVGISWPVAMGNWVKPFAENVSQATVDAYSSATPLGLMLQLKNAVEATPEEIYQLTRNIPALKDMFLGTISGSMGEVSALALLLGGAYILFRKHIDWRIPTIYIGTVFVFSLIFNRGFDPLWFAAFNVFSGGLIIGAFFMATDWVTSPVTKNGRVIFALGLGILTFLIRNGGVYPEGVLYSILIMNMFTPLIDRLTRGRVFGMVKKRG